MTITVLPPSGSPIRRVRDLASGRVLERHSPDAAELVGTGAFAYADGAQSLREQMAAMDAGALLALARAQGLPLAGVTATTSDEIVARLLPLAESGALTLPTTEA